MRKLCFSFWTSRAFISSKVVLGEILSSMSIPISAATFSVVSVLLTSVSAVRTISGIADVVSSAVVIARHLFTFCASLLRVDRFYALKSDVGMNFEGKKKTKEKKIRETYHDTDRGKVRSLRCRHARVLQEPFVDVITNDRALWSTTLVPIRIRPFFGDFVDFVFGFIVQSRSRHDFGDQVSIDFARRHGIFLADD